MPLRAIAPLVRRLVCAGTGHMHVHFARHAALDAMRIHRLTGIPYSVTAHAWDIFKQPENLVEKLEGAAFATSGCDYNIRHLRSLVAPEARDRIHKVVMGVDPKQFRRTAPYDRDGTVLAIGRLVEKKGFGHLVRAAAQLRDFERMGRIVIVGDGELRGDLERLARDLEVDRTVRFAGPKRHEEIKELVEEAALLVMPAVVAADGDRDSMPVVVKEALAMGVPVVASDEVGLPEVVREEWGRLVPPADPQALAAAIRELLSMPTDARAEMGERGREFVCERFAVVDQTRLLASLILRAREPGS